MVVSPACGLGGSTTGETTSPFTTQRRNGRAFASLTARGGGLPIGVIGTRRPRPRRAPAVGALPPRAAASSDRGPMLPETQVPARDEGGLALPPRGSQAGGPR